MRLLALIFLFLLAAAPAEAGWRIDRSLAIAQEVWKPTCGALSLAYGDPVSAGASAEADAWAWPGNCRIGINASQHYEFEELCTIVLHEAGHVAGMGHADRGIMRATRVFVEAHETSHGRT